VEIGEFFVITEKIAKNGANGEGEGHANQTNTIFGTNFGQPMGENRQSHFLYGRRAESEFMGEEKSASTHWPKGEAIEYRGGELPAGAEKRKEGRTIQFWGFPTLEPSSLKFPISSVAVFYSRLSHANLAVGHSIL
jgi:hypothetical protein